MDTVSPSFLIQLSRYDRYSRALEYGHQGDIRALLREAQAASGSGDLLTEWLAVRLKQPLAGRHWPAVITAQSLGWQAYYRGDLLSAAAFFEDAWRQISAGEPHYGFRPDVALGLGKVYTRTGHWRSARDWILVFLADARRTGDLFAVTQGYGALGELFLRADQGQPALACLNIAFHVLPAGSGQQSRQLNYLASALMRNREWLRAESLLMTGLQNARAMLSAGIDSQEAAASIWHALARLQFLDLERHPDRPPESRRRGAEDITSLQAAVAPVAQGMLAAGQSLDAWRRGRIEEAVNRLESAAGQLGQGFPMEHAWVMRLLGALTGGNADCPEDARRLMALTPLPAPAPEGVLDLTWRHILLGPENGFAALASPDTDAGRLACCWRLFFL